MTCRQVTTLLDAFADGELPAEDTFEVERHVANCEGCSERLRFSGALRKSIQQAVRSGVEPSLGFESRLATALRAERERLLETDQEAEARPGGVTVSPTVRSRRTLWPALVAAAAAMLSLTAWLDGPRRREAPPEVSLREREAAQAAMDSSPEQILDELVNYHAAPPEPQVMTEPGLAAKFEPEVGVPVHVPALKQYGAAWEGASVVPVRNQRAAVFRYRISNHPVTVYVYDARRTPLRGVLEPRVVRNQPVHVGERRGYSIAAREQRGVGYAVASDLNGDESAELVSTIY